MMYREQQQLQNNQRHLNYNDDRYDSSESDSSSESEADEADEVPENNQGIVENNDAQDNNGNIAQLFEVNNDNNANDVPNVGLLDEIHLDPINCANRCSPGPSNENLLCNAVEKVVERLDEDDSRSNQNIPFDENSRGNYELASLLDEDRRPECNINVNLPPPLNDDSSRDSMEVDYENEAMEIERMSLNGAGEVKELIRNESDSLHCLFNDECSNYFKGGNLLESDKKCNCQKCAWEVPTNRCINCTNDFCDKNDECCRNDKSLEPRVLSCQNKIDENTDDSDGVSQPKRRRTNSYCCTDDKIPAVKTSCDNNFPNLDKPIVNENESESVTGKQENKESVNECTCYLEKLDHINGHSSKMCLELAKAPCEKCSVKKPETLESGSSIDEPTAGPSGIQKDDIAEVKLPEAESVEEVKPEEVKPSLAVAVLAEPVRPALERENIPKPPKRVKVNNNNAVNKVKAPRTIFDKALDAVGMNWDNQHLKNILASDNYCLSSKDSVQIAGSTRSALQSNVTVFKTNFNVIGQPLWHEPLSMCAARVDSLRSHGHTDAAIRLSVSVVRTIKQYQKDSQALWHRYKMLTPQPEYDDNEEMINLNSCCCGCNKTVMSGMKLASNTNEYKSVAPENTHNMDCNSHQFRDRFRRYPPYDYNQQQRYQSTDRRACRRCYDYNYRIGYDMKRNPMPYAYQPVANNYNRHFVDNGINNPYHRRSYGPYGGPAMYNAQHRYNMSSSMNPKYQRNNYGAHSAYHGDICHNDNCMIQRYHQQQQQQQHPQQQQQHQQPMDISVNNNRPRCDIRTEHQCSVPHAQHNIQMPSTSNAYMRMPSNVMNESQKDSVTLNPTAPPPNDSTIQNPPQLCSNVKPSSAIQSDNKICNIHSKGQCCIKNYCCQPIEKPNTSREHHHHHQPPQPQPTQPNCVKPCCYRPRPWPSNNLGYDVNSSRMEPYKHCSEHVSASISSSSSISAAAGSASTSNHCQSNRCDRCIEKPNKMSINCGASTSKGVTSIASGSSSSSSSLATTSRSDYQNQQQIQHQINELLRNRNPNCVAKCIDCNLGCQMELPLDAVACLFDCLTEACIIPDSVNGPGMGRLSFDSIPPSPNSSGDEANNSMNNLNNIIPPRYQHIPVPFSQDPNETYLSLAFDAAIIALGKQRLMPQGLYSQHVFCKQQDQLIARLRHIDLDRLLIEVIRNLTMQLLDGGPTSGLGCNAHTDSVPMHTLARYLFASLLNHNVDLAFKVGLRAMRLSVLEDHIDNTGEGLDENYQRDGIQLGRYPRWWTLGHLENQQSSLGSTMLSAAKGDPARLAIVLESARRNVHSSSHLFKLAQDAYRFGTPDSETRNETLLQVAFELGLQVMRMTLTCLNWRRREMVRWMVTCATQLGVDALKSIMQNWYHLFTPTEATGPVASTIMSHTARMNLSLRVSFLYRHLLHINLTRFMNF